MVGIWEFRFEEVFYHNVSVPELFVQTIIFMLNIYLLSGRHWDKCLAGAYVASPITTPGTESLMSVPGR